MLSLPRSCFVRLPKTSGLGAASCPVRAISDRPYLRVSCLKGKAGEEPRDSQYLCRFVREPYAQAVRRVCGQTQNRLTSKAKRLWTLEALAGTTV
jgi:hypothetical protein